jgi:hypothetical protein
LLTHDRAIADFEQALKLDPSLVYARQAREHVQGLLPRGEVIAAGIEPLIVNVAYGS